MSMDTTPTTTSPTRPPPSGQGPPEQMAASSTSAGESDQFMTVTLWQNFAKAFQLAATSSVEQMISLEYEASRGRAELQQLHEQRVEQLSVLQAKREQILADINQYLQPFTDPLPGQPPRQ